MLSHAPSFSPTTPIHRTGASVQAIREEVFRMVKLPRKGRKGLSTAVHCDLTARSKNASRPDAGIREQSRIARDFIAEEIEMILRAAAQENSDCSMSLLELAVLFSLRVGYTINQVLRVLGAPPFKEYLQSRKEFDVLHGQCVLVKRHTGNGDACPDTPQGATNSSTFNFSSAREDNCSTAREDSGSTPRTVSTSCATSSARPATRNDDSDYLNGPASDNVSPSNAFEEKWNRHLVGVPENNALSSLVKKGRQRALRKLDSSGSANRVSQAMISHSRTLDKLMNAVSAKLEAESSLAISRIQRSGSIAKGAETESFAQMIVFVKDLPFDKHEDWLPQFLAKVHSILCNGHKKPHLCVYDKLDIRKNCIRASVRRLAFLDIIFSPLIEVQAAIVAMRNVEQEQLVYYEPALLCPRLEFFSKLSSVAEKTILFLKKWRDQQNWISAWYRPSDAILEMLVAFQAMKTDCSEKQGTAARQAFQMLERFAHLRIVFFEYFRLDDIPKKFHDVRPLILDVTNPYVNLADTSLFNSSQIISLAQQTHFTTR